MKLIGILLLCVNIFSLIFMGLDKYKAIKQQFRISEKALFLSALPFSSYGFFLGMKLFRHKTQKKRFVLGSYFLMSLHTIIILYCLHKQLSFEEILRQFKI